MCHLPASVLICPIIDSTHNTAAAIRALPGYICWVDYTWPKPPGFGWKPTEKQSPLYLFISVLTNT